MKEMKLSDLIQESMGKITRVAEGSGFHEKLAMMGVKEGSRVRVIKSAEFGGPVVIELDRNSIAVGHGMARKIYVGVEE